MSGFGGPLCSRPDMGRDARAAAIEEASRALVSETVSVLLMPVVGGERRLHLAFQHSEPALLSIGAARTLQRQLAQLLAVAEGRPPK